MEFPFDGTVFVEKILRVQPNMKKLLLLLLRAADTESATSLSRSLWFSVFSTHNSSLVTTLCCQNQLYITAR
ncbi:hypothetical protein WN943_014722 [Citrus x changshan-huyou]